LSALIRDPALVDRQAEFVRRILDGEHEQAAALNAGYNSESAGFRLVRLPQVAQAIHLELSRRLTTAAAPLAYRVGMSLLKDEKTAARIRADIALKFLSMAGHGAKEGGNASHDKPLAEMTSSELHSYLERNQAEIDRLEAELASRAKDVNASHNAQEPLVLDAKPLDYLD
jgi:uncharacterized small protein (DUF1192 family)